MTDRRFTNVELESRLNRDEAQREDALRVVKARHQAQADAEKAAADAAELAREEESRAAKESEVKRGMRESWLRHGGRPEAFDACWPALYQDYLKTKVLGDLDESVLASRRARAFRPTL